jgi:uracil-DNA glycosylase family 4
MTQIKGFYQDKKGNTKAEKNTCASCGLWKNGDCYAIQPYGNFKKRILNIGESPGKTECEEDKLWAGKIGRILKRMYKRLGIDLFEDCININSVNCWPGPNNKKPTKKQIDACRNMMNEKNIRKYEPDLIILFGSAALESFLDHRWGEALGGINKWRGYCIPDRDYKAWVCPVFHPSYIAKMDEEVYNIWARDLEKAIGKLDEERPRFKKPDIEFIDDLSVLYDIKSDLTAVDFETTALKPDAKGQRIITCSIADTVDHAYVFELPKIRKEQKPLLDYLQDQDIKKVCANGKYEWRWAMQRLKVEMKGFVYDTMLGQHILDNRTGVTGLDFQTYVNFGIVDYSSKVKTYLKPDKSTGNSFNYIFDLVSTEEGKNDLLYYNGMDTICELRIAWQQIEELDYNFIGIV